MEILGSYHNQLKAFLWSHLNFVTTHFRICFLVFYEIVGFVRSAHSCINQPTIWWQIVHWITNSVQENYKFRTCWVHQIVFCFCLDIQDNLMYTKCDETVVFLCWTNNLSSCFRLMGARMSASDKYLPVHEFSATLKKFWTHCVFLKQLGIALKEVGCRIRTSQVFSELR